MDRVREAVVSDYRRAWWDGEADAYERRNPNATGLQPRVLDAIAREVNPGDSILEVGCGSGANLRGIETRIRGRIACFGCDPSEIALENGGRRHQSMSSIGPHQTRFRTLIPRLISCC